MSATKHQYLQDTAPGSRIVKLNWEGCMVLRFGILLPLLAVLLFDFGEVVEDGGNGKIVDETKPEIDSEEGKEKSGNSPADHSASESDTERGAEYADRPSGGSIKAKGATVTGGSTSIKSKSTVVQAPD